MGADDRGAALAHRVLVEGEYRDARSLREDEPATAAALDLSVPVSALL